MRILAIDYGAVRIGIALSDPTGTLAKPLPFLTAKGDAKLAKEVAALATKEGVVRILIGLPRHMNGELGEAAEKVKAFAAVLGQATTIPLKLVDERLSTIQASRQLHDSGKNTRKQRERIDSEAAAVFLQSYLDSEGTSTLPPLEL